jgi:hypothetical protein
MTEFPISTQGGNQQQQPKSVSHLSSTESTKSQYNHIGKTTDKLTQNPKDDGTVSIIAFTNIAMVR